MAISTKDFTTLVRDQVAAIQGAARSLIDLSVGSVLRAIVEAGASVVLWLQALLLQLAATTRAATSSGADLDSWVGDYGVTRLSAKAASGSVTFSRFTNTLQAVVPIGALVQTQDGSQTFSVTVDTGNANYSATLAGYVLAPGVSSIIVPVAAAAAGSAGNVSAGQINTIGQAIAGVDTVSNAAPLTTGADAESDAALRTRFQAFIQSLAEGTVGAVKYAVTSLQSGVTCKVIENQDYNGTTDYGYFTVIVDDGTGAPTSTFLNTAANAVEAVRGCTIRYGVFGPVVVNASVAMTVAIGAGYDAVATKAAVQAAIVAYINSLTLGQSLPFTRLAQIAYDTSPGVTNVAAVTLNSGTADLSVTGLQILKTNTGIVVVS